MATDLDILFRTEAGRLDSSTELAGTARDAIRKWLKRRQVVVPLAANATLTNVAETAVFNVDADKYPNGVRVISAKLNLGTTYTAANTDTMTLTLAVRDGAGGSATTIMTANTAATTAGGLGDVTAFVPKALTVTAANSVCNANSVVTFTQARASVNTTGFTTGGALTFVIEEL